MNWDIFTGFWLGALSLLIIEFAFIWGVDEEEDQDHDHDDKNHFQPT